MLYRADSSGSRRTPSAPPEVLAFHRSLPEYAVTPLHDVPALATELGLGRVLVKDESHRLGLPAFKALGAWWAIHQARQPHTETLVTATDGNHGRAVARRAHQLGLRSHIFIPDVVSAAAVDAIRSEGAEVTVLPTSYDEAVLAAAASATDERLLIQDSAWPGYEEIPQLIVDGYSTLFRELDVAADLLVVPMGVGSAAQAAVAHGGDVLGVEPSNAACITTSLLAGHPVTVQTSNTVMAGLNCGTPSSLAWPVLRDGLHASVTVDDPDALQASEDLAALGISSGPSGAATLAGLRAARASLDLTADSTVVLISTEGR
ncbi:pyridoxal-phosphate dependent enzyme [Kribbella sp. NPDC051770]|uniref:pyridoxal-phosphate dependent enzyme n=1 Tax=Kribbella sp. NPDC051770 TaxID=3155413 RepID=UPI0034468954